jgi:hypothetical protein
MAHIKNYKIIAVAVILGEGLIKICQAIFNFRIKVMIHWQARFNNFYCWALLVLIAISLGCTTLSKRDIEPNRLKEFPQYWLTTSVYAGQFYDNARLALVDYRPFSAIDDAQTIDGYTIFPPGATHTIPVGTLVKIVDISYPNDQTKFNRPLYSPRNNIWVSLRIAKERGQVSIFRDKTHILIMPKKITTERQVKGYLARFLSINDPNRWLLQQQSYIQDAIVKKRPAIGMTREHLVAALGPPVKKQYQRKTDVHDAQEIWHYHDYFVVIIDEKVSKFKRLDIKH